MKTGLSSQRRRWIFAVRGLMGLAAGLTCALVLFLLEIGRASCRERV